MVRRTRAALLLAFASAVVAYVADTRAPRGGLVAPALACSCANSMPPALDPFGRDIPRPRNARLRFTPIWTGAADREWANANGFDGTRWNILLRKKGDTKNVPTDQRVVGLAEARVLEIWPRAPLEANATYEVLRGPTDALSPGGWPILQAQLTTTAAIDSTPPTWAGITSVAYLSHGRQSGSSCDVDAPVIDLAVTDAKDDTTPPDEIRLGVWVANASGAFDYGGAPLVLARPSPGHAYLGRTGLCGGETFAVEKKKMRLGVRAIDFAGNVSAPTEVDFDPEHNTIAALPAPSGTAATPAPGGSTASSPPPRTTRGCSYAPF